MTVLPATDSDTVVSLSNHGWWAWPSFDKLRTKAARAGASCPVED
jgi:hypothetical protein